jgi:hypothetical protein
VCFPPLFLSVLVHRVKVEDSCLVGVRKVGSIPGLLLDQRWVIFYIKFYGSRGCDKILDIYHNCDFILLCTSQVHVPKPIRKPRIKKGMGKCGGTQIPYR